MSSMLLDRAACGMYVNCNLSTIWLGLCFVSILFNTSMPCLQDAWFFAYQVGRNQRHLPNLLGSAAQ